MDALIFMNQLNIKPAPDSLKFRVWVAFAVFGQSQRVSQGTRFSDVRVLRLLVWRRFLDSCVKQSRV